MAWKQKLAVKAVEAAKAGIGMAKDKIENEHATSRIKALKDMRDDQPVTIEALLVVLVDAVHQDDSGEPSKRDVKKAGKRRQRVAGTVGMFAGPIGMYVASLYCEAEIMCDVADRHRLVLSDEDLAAHLLVMWNAMPDFVSATAAIDGTGQSVAGRMATQLHGKVTAKPLDEMTKRDAVLALWRLRGLISNTSMPERANPKDILLPGSRVKAITKAAERQLGVTAERTRIFTRRDQAPPRAARQVENNGHACDLTACESDVLIVEDPPARG